MNKRETALEIIRIEYAKYGESSIISMRAFVENIISLEAYNAAARKGMHQYETNKVLSVPNVNWWSTDE